MNTTEKKTLATSQNWPMQALADFYGLTINHVRSVSNAADNGPVDRFDFEKRLVRDGFASLEMLALEFGVPAAPLEGRMRRQVTNGPPAIPLDSYGQDHRYLLPRRFGEAWIKEILPKHKVWSSLDTRARDLARELTCEPLICAVSLKFQETPTAVATCRCIATWDFVSRAHQEYFENRKHLSLEPDHIGWHAIYDDSSWKDKLWSNDLTNYQNYLLARGVK